MINYLSLKRDCSSDMMYKVIQTFIQLSRKKNKSLWILSYKEKVGDRIWFRGFGCTPTGLLQNKYWPDQVIPGDQFIIDLTQCQNTVILDGSYRVVANPSNFYWSNCVK